MCCGEKMQEIIPVRQMQRRKARSCHPSGWQEGHCNGRRGGHPMLEEHYIQWISIETKEGNQRKILKPVRRRRRNLC